MRILRLGLAASVLALAAMATEVAAQSFSERLRQLQNSVTATPLLQKTQPSDAAPAADDAAAQATANIPGMTLAQPGKQSLALAGYSSGFSPVRGMLSSGDFDGAIALFQTGAGRDAATSTQAAAAQGAASLTATTSAPSTGDAAAPAAARPRSLLSSRDVFLSNAELGVMHFDAGRYAEAVTSFKAAEAEVREDRRERETSGRMGSIMRSAGSAMRQTTAFALGRGELNTYRERDYEKILQLNYLALSYLIQGDRAAYNVSRRAAEEQNVAREKFLVDIAESNSSLKDNIAALEQRNAQRATAAGDASTPQPGAASPQPGGQVDLISAISNFQSEYAQYDAVADRVPSAYVNPLGFYLTGLIQEINSVEQPALRDNARISYGKALELQPSSPTLQAAVAAVTTRRAPNAPAERVVHVIIGEGFAPTRQLLVYGFQLDGTVIPIKAPVFTPTASTIARIDIANARGVKLTSLEAVGDVEALMLRAQKDRMSQITSGVILSVVRSVGEQRLGAAAGPLGQLAVRAKQASDTPDMRSWASLPRRFMIARVVVPAGATELRVNTYDAGGRVVSTQTAAVDPNERHQVLYGRAADGFLRLTPPRRLWIPPETETASAAPTPAPPPN